MRVADSESGFIKQFGTVHDPKTGALALDANVVSIWGVCQQCLTLVPYVLSPSIADRFGRRAICWVFLFAGVIEIILESVARHWTVWLVAKIFDGFMCGLIQPGPLTLMSEIVMPQMRGNVLSAFALCWCFGGMFSSIGLQILNTVGLTAFTLHNCAHPNNVTLSRLLRQSISPWCIPSGSLLPSLPCPALFFPNPLVCGAPCCLLDVADI